MATEKFQPDHRKTAPAGAAGQGPDRKRISVVYITGPGRTGSTLIERLLESYDNVASVGELGLLWFYVTRLKLGLADIRCPCGEALPDCPRWRAILAAAGFADPDIEELIALQQATFRARHFLLYFLPVVGRSFRKRLQRLADLTGRFYRAAAEVDGAEIIVDCTLNPSGVLLAKYIDGIDLHVKHLVRRPEAVTYSWSVRKYHPGFRFHAGGWSPLRAIADWMSANLRAEMLRLVTPVSRYSYEWFVRSPRTNLQTLMADVPRFKNGVSNAFLSETEAMLDSRHAILGNPDRFRSGKITIKADERYVTGLPWRTRVLAVMLTFPLYLLYGYGRREHRAGTADDDSGGRPSRL